MSTLGELAFARAAGIEGERIVFPGNNKSLEELRAAAGAAALVVLDAPREVELAAEAGVRRVLVRLTPGGEALTHRAIQTAHDESKFGLSPEAAAGVHAGLVVVLGSAAAGVGGAARCPAGGGTRRRAS